MSNIITWLHISDIHFNPRKAWRDAIVRDNLLKYLAEIFSENNELYPDLIFCTGDIAFGTLTSSSLDEQYKEAELFFTKLLDVCGRGNAPFQKEHLFIVPGNHDIDRNKINSLQQETFARWANNASEHIPHINQMVDEYNRDFQDAIRRLEAYSTFVKDNFPHQHDPDGRHLYAKIVMINGHRIGVAGFNSAWSCAGPEDDRSIWLAAEWQFNAAHKSIRDADIRIGLIHHPIDWLNKADRDTAVRRVTTDFHFWLHGHSHSAWVTPAESHVIIAAGAIGAQNSEEFGFNIVQINCEGQGTLYPYEHRAGSATWKVATIDTHAPQGLWRFRLPVSITPYTQSLPSKFHSNDFFEIPDEDIHALKDYTDDDFIRLIEKYSDNLPNDLRQSLIREIITHAWKKIIFSPFFANSLMTSMTAEQQGIALIILPLCKIATAENIASDELQHFFSTLTDYKNNEIEEYRWIYMHLTSKMIRHILYHRKELSQSLPFQRVIEEIAALNCTFWDKFLFDLFLRHKCEFISIPNDLLELIISASKRYRSQNPNAPMTLIYPFINFTMDMLRNGNIDELVDIIYNLTKNCKDHIDCKWCVTSWLRIVPLRDFSDDEINYYSNLRSLIDQFPQPLKLSSPYLSFLYLKSYLYSFIQTGSLEFLSSYEKKFTKTKNLHYHSQITHLQLEYASCLYLFCQYSDTDSLNSLKIVKIAENNQTNPTENPLFSNPLVDNIKKIQNGFRVDTDLRGNLFRWIIAYAKQLTMIYAKPYIEENHLRIRQFKSSLKIYRNRHIFIEAALSSLRLYSKYLSNYSPSFSAQSCRSFEIVPRGQHLDMLKNYISRALDADQYSICRNALYILKGLYWTYYYGDVKDRILIRKFLNKVKYITGIGKGQPKLFWIYYATILIEENSNELDIMNYLSFFFDQSSRKYYQLALRREEEVVLRFPDKLVNFLKKKSDRSLIAAVLSEEMTNSETWNVLGTTAFNNRKKDEISFLKQAVNFYTAAKCFARNSKDYDQKYCYNYIRCKSMIFLHDKKPPDDFFVRDTIFYLNRPEAEMFAFKKECLIPFFNIVNNFFNELTYETRAHVKDLVQMKRWVRRSCEFAVAILTL